MGSSHTGVLIFGGQAMTVEVNVHASMPLNKALKALDDMGETKFNLMPHGEVSCAGFARLEDRRFFLMYFPPKRRQLVWKNKHTGEQRAFIVWWPHVYLGIFFRGGAIEDGYAMFAKKKITSLSDKLGRAPLPNLSKKYGHICEGAKGMWSVMDRPDETAMKYAEYFLKSEWISDINDHWSYVPKELWVPGWDFKKPIQGDSSIEDLNQKMIGIWEALSETDPRAVENLGWPEHFTIADLVTHEWKGKESLGGSPLSAEQIQSILQGGQHLGPEVGQIVAAPHYATVQIHPQQ